MPIKEFELREIGRGKFNKKLIIADGSFINKGNTHAEIYRVWPYCLISYREFGKEPFTHYFTNHELEWGEYKRFNIVECKYKPKKQTWGHYKEL